MVAAYWLSEALLSSPQPQTALPSSLDRSRHPWVPSATLLLAGALLAGFAIAWPQQRLLAHLGTGTKVESAVGTEDLAWLAGLRAMTAMLAVALMIGGLTATRRQVANRLSRPRPYLGVLLVLAVFLLTTPFSLLGWREFLYDVGSELKANTLRGEHAQWLTCLRWYQAGESLALLPAMLAGGIALRRSRAGRPVLLYLLLSYLAIGAAQRGHPRYLTPVLPFLFVLAGGGFAWFRGRLGPTRPRLAAGLLAGLLAIAAIETAAKLGAARQELQRPDEMWQTYQWVTAQSRAPLFLAGYGPGVELGQVGWSVRAIPRQSLANPAGPAQTEASEGDLLLIDGLARVHLTGPLTARLQPLFSLDQGYGQYLYRFSTPVGFGDSIPAGEEVEIP
jgi:hypothetical protein